MDDFESLLAEYGYEYPPEAIAQLPASPRDSARLLVTDRNGEGEKWTTFARIAEYLPPRSVVVFNKTKVIPARLELVKETGGKVRVLYIGKEERAWKVMCDRPLAVGAALSLVKSSAIKFRVSAQDGKYWHLLPNFSLEKTFSILEKYGKTPIPPYIKESPLTEAGLKKKYQAVFAKVRGSVAAPTASLHFTPRLLKKIKAAGASVEFITLHVGLGTFAPLTEEAVARGELHAEWYEIDPKTASRLEKSKKNGHPIVAVGTTVARTLESASDEKGSIARPEGETRLFMKPPYAPHFVDSLITNFHVPRSSLLMLVSCFIPREKLLSLYKKAISRGFKLFSFGDGMLLR